MMENSGRGASRNGVPHNNSTGGKKTEAPNGFEGMNFETKRRPYSNSNSETNKNDKVGNDANLDRKRDHH